MQLVEEKLDTVFSGVEEKRNFTIKSNSKAYKVLSDKLYSDKIKAVVRELSTNASDEHKTCGKPEVPFDVYFPTRLEPNFMVRDYGRGLSKEDCLTLYSTYFESTKTDSNLTTGCLGLGSKSPFAYTDSFTVESIHNGIKYVYVAIMETHGPTINLLHSEPTDEHSGLCIKVPVKEEDFFEFRQKAKDVYRWFDVAPNLFPSDIDVTKSTPTYSGNGWSQYKSISTSLVMGQVKYSINIDQLENSNVKNFLRNIHVVIHADIGSVDITPSRESLSYDSRTIKYIEDRVHAIIDEFQDKLDKELAECKSFYQACLLCNNSSNPLAKAGGKFNDKKITSSFDIDNLFSFSYSERTYSQKVSTISLLSIRSVVINDIPKSKQKKSMFLALYKSNSYIRLYNGTLEDFKKAIGASNEDEIVLEKLSDIIESQPMLQRHKKSTFSCSKFNKDTGRFEEVKMSLKYDDAVYMYESRGSYFLYDSYIIPTGTLYTFLKTFLEGKDIDVYTIKPCKKKDVTGRKNWTKLSDIIEKHFKDYYDKNQAEIDAYFQLIYFKDFNLAKEINIPEIQELVTKYEEYNKIKSNCKLTQEDFDLMNFARYLSFDIRQKFRQNYIDFDPEFNKIMKDRYPLLSYFSNSRKTSLEYIADMDELETLRKRYSDEICNK